MAASSYRWANYWAGGRNEVVWCRVVAGQQAEIVAAEKFSSWLQEIKKLMAAGGGKGASGRWVDGGDAGGRWDKKWPVEKGVRRLAGGDFGGSS
ncbi:hypothetical protein MRB53_014103 [Persea americana]|uniref:Uncharacterized protein n=1 Tax=Persea americana TaxID=3435 RepID=A0ACC2KAA2_PERAE|nr:hypothetical protein MRB53_014103 [Persea americana]